MSSSHIAELVALFACALTTAGIALAAPSAGVAGQLLFDAASGTTYRNHVKLVPDPLGGDAKVLIAERVAKDKCQMTFVNDKGFFAVPASYTGKVVLRVLVHGKNRLRVALVSGQNIKSYYRDVAGAGDKWEDVELDLSELKGKVPAGEQIKDITVWLLAPEKDAALDKDARLHFDRASYLAAP
jgi:hypothetical protein